MRMQMSQNEQQIFFISHNATRYALVSIISNGLACSQTVYFLFKVGRARVIKNKNYGGFIDRQN